MLPKSVLILFAAILITLTSYSKAQAWGCYQAGYTHYGPATGVHHYGYTGYHSGGDAGYHSGGGYHYGGYHYGGYHSGGSGGGYHYGYHYGYARRW